MPPLTGPPSLVAIACGWLLGLWTGGALRPPEPALLALVALLAAGAMWMLATRGHLAPRPSSRVRTTARVGGPLVAALAGLACGAVPPTHLPTPPAGLARFEGRVLTSEYVQDGRARALVAVTRGQRLSDGRAIAAGTRLFVGPHPLPRGARVRVLGRVQAFSEFRNPTPHPPWPRRAPDGFAWVRAPDAQRVLSTPFGARTMNAARDRLRTGLERTLPAHHAAIASALVLGERGRLPDTLRDQVTDAGLAHVLAISGLHIALLAGCLLAGIRASLRWVTPLATRMATDRLAYALGVPLAFGLAALCGGGASAMRAATTAAIAWGLLAANRRPSSGAVCALAAIAITAHAPHDAGNPGLVLSIVATAAILSRPASDSSQGPLRMALLISLRTMIATAPVITWCFGRVPLAGLATNVVGVPLVALTVLPGCAIHALCAAAAPPLASLTAGPTGVAIDAFTTICRLGASLPLVITPPPLTVSQGLSLAAGCGGLLLCRRHRSRALVLGLCALALLLGEWRVRQVERPTGVLRVTFLDVGQGDAALVDLPDGRLMLIDAGGDPVGSRDPGEQVLVPLLRARRRARVDIAVLSHPHPDHYGGMAAVHGRFPVGELWDSGQASAEQDMLSTAADTAGLLDRMARAGTRILGPADLCGRTRMLGGARVEVLAPCPRHDPGYGANDNSLVLRISYGKRRVLFTGDVERHGERRLVAGGRDLSADVLKVPHHGSRTSSGDALLAAVDPRLAIISAGRHNRFGHPHGEVLARLRAHRISALLLASTGGTIIRTDGTRLSVRTVAEPGPRYLQ